MPAFRDLGREGGREGGLVDVDEEGDAAGKDKQLGAGIEGPRKGGREGDR